MSEKITAHVRNISDAEYAVCVHRLAVVRKVVEDGNCRDDHVLAAIELGISERTLRSLIYRYQSSTDRTVRCMLPRKCGRRLGAYLLPPTVEAIIAGHISKNYTGKVVVKIRRLHQEISADCRKAKLPIPTYETLRRRIQRLPAEKRLAGLDGKKAAKQALTPVVGAFFVQGAYSVIQIDHTPFDVIVVDSSSRTPIGRPWLTLAMDVASRMVAGFYVTLECPSFLSTALCLRNALLPKSPFLFAHGYDFAWPCEGIPDFIHTDNGADFRGINLQKILTAYDIGHQLRPIGKPHYGGHIERLIGTFMGEMHFLPGTTFENAEQHRKRKYDSAKEALLTLDELEAYFCAQVNQYHHTRHSALLRPPISAWADELANRSSPLRSVQGYRRLAVDFLPSKTRTVSREGIRFEKIKYWNNDLTCLLGAEDRSIQVNYDPRNLSTIYAILPEQEFIEVKYANTGRPAVTLMEWNASRLELSRSNRGPLHEDQIFEMVMAKRRIVSNAKADKRSIKRSAARQIERTSRAINAEPPALLGQDQTSRSAPSMLSHSTASQITSDTANLCDVEDW